MRFAILTVTASAILTVFLSNSATSAVYFHFNQIGPILYDFSGVQAPVHARVRGWIALDEERLANGYDVSLSHSMHGEPSGIRPRQYGIENFRLEIFRTHGNTPSRVLLISFQDLFAGRDSLFDLVINSDVDEVPDIDFSWQGHEFDRGVSITTRSGILTGTVAGALGLAPDFGGAQVDSEGCYLTAACTFVGTLTTQSPVAAVPLPPALPVMLVGLMGLAVVQRRRRGSA